MDRLCNLGRAPLSDTAPPQNQGIRSEEPAPGFDFEAHGRDAVDRYRLVEPAYRECAHAVYAVLTNALDADGILVHSVQWRAKTATSFGIKASRPSGDDPSTPKYGDPLREITDLAGVRVITFLRDAAERVCAIVEREFTILEKTNRPGVVQGEVKLGYQSTHYLVQFSGRRNTLPEYARFSQITTEVQVRTILQHAWAEIEHDIQYKAVEAIPSAIRKRFMALAGLLEIADREFQAIADEDQRVRTDARRLVAEGHLDRVEITPDSLAVYLNEKFGPDGRMSEWSYAWSTTLLKRLGFRTLAELAECIAPYDDDAVSRTIWGSRQGQLTRLEDVLLAGMGEVLITSHPWYESTWYAERAREHLAKLRAHNVPIGAYRPRGHADAVGLAAQ